MHESDELIDPTIRSTSSANEKKETLPNAIAILVLGILSIQLSFAYGIPGLICGIIALSKWKSRKQLYLEDPDHYAHWSYKVAKIGNTCAIIGVSLSALIMLIMVMVIVAVNS